jgi:hypothetical protein
MAIADELGELRPSYGGVVHTSSKRMFEKSSSW